MDLTQIETISKALGDETRLAVYQAIAAKRGMTCGELVEIHGVTPATISHHLKILMDAGLIACSKKGQFVHSRVVRGIIDDYSKALRRLASGTTTARRRKRQT